MWISGRHPQFPKNLAGQKVTFKVSPITSRCRPNVKVDDYRWKRAIKKTETFMTLPCQQLKIV